MFVKVRTFVSNLEAYFNIFPLVRVLQLEEIKLFEMEQVGHDRVGEGFDFGIEVAYHPIVKAPRGLDFIFCIRQFVHELGHILVGFELRVGFYRNAETPHEPAERLFGLGQIRGIAQLLRVERSRARPRNIFEQLLFVLHVPFDARDQIGNEVVPALELHINITPAFLRSVAQADEGVEDHDEPEYENANDNERYSES